MNGGKYAEGLYQWDMSADNSLRTPNVKNMALNDTMGPRNQFTLIQTSLLMGQRGYDFTNPNAFAPVQYARSTLRPQYANSGDSVANIGANIGRSNTMRGVFGW